MWLRELLLLALVTAMLASPVNKKCPKMCECSAKLVKCSSLDSGKFSSDVYNLKIVSPTPIVLTNNIFQKVGLKSLNFLHIENTTISSIEPNAFSGVGLNTLSFLNCKLPSLENLDTTSMATTLKKLIFANSSISGYEHLNLNSLEELEISNCNITHIPKDSFANMPDLSYISLSNNLIKNFDASTFTNLPSLIDLKMTFNQISEIPPELFNNETDLSSINLSNNPITRVEVKSPSKVEELILRSCEIKEFSGGKYLSTLASLDLGKNNIEDLPVDTFNNMEYLEYLDLSNNILQSLDPTLFTKNSRLLKINLDNNELKTIPKFTTVDGHFQTFYFSCNNCLLEDIEEDVFENFPGIATLSLSNNKLRNIKEKTFHSLRSLVELDLSFNDISELKPSVFSKNPELTTLALAGNSLKYIDCKLFLNNPALKNLDVSYGQLTKLWKEPICEFSSLKVLNIANNVKITNIAKKDLQVVKNLDVLDISGIKLECGSDFKEFIKWLTKHDVASSSLMRKSFETIVLPEIVFPESGLSWENVAKLNCPDNNDDYDNNEVDDTDDDLKDTDKEDDDDDDDDDESDVLDETFKIEDDYGLYDDLEKNSKLLREEIVEETNVYLWPTLVFLGTAIIVLIICSLNILWCIKRRSSPPSLTLSHIQILPWSSGATIKKHSGSVYRPLSEEKLPQPLMTKFNRYEQVPTHVGSQNA